MTPELDSVQRDKKRHRSIIRNGFRSRLRGEGPNSSKVRDDFISLSNGVISNGKCQGNHTGDSVMQRKSILALKEGLFKGGGNKGGIKNTGCIIKLWPACKPVSKVISM